MHIMAIVSAVAVVLALALSGAARLMVGVVVLAAISWAVWVSRPGDQWAGFDASQIEFRQIGMDRHGDNIEAVIVNHGDRSLYAIKLAVTMRECRGTSCDIIGSTVTELKRRGGRSLKPGYMAALITIGGLRDMPRGPLRDGILELDYQLVGVR